MESNRKSAFTFDHIKKNYSEVVEFGYKVVTCDEYTRLEAGKEHPKILINRVDVDINLKKAERLGFIFNDLDIKASFFIRLHAHQYNPFSFEGYRIIKFLKESGHEIGYHSEIIDQGTIWQEDPIDCLKRDIRVLNAMFDINITGVASHGGMTGLNNLDFWKTHKASDFDLKYEAYDWFDDTFYVSDSEWFQWKCYNKGKLENEDRRSLSQHAMDGHKVIYALIHSDTYYDRHIYE